MDEPLEKAIYRLVSVGLAIFAIAGVWKGQIFGEMEVFAMLSIAFAVLSK